MTDYASMTKKDLLALAKQLDIPGRWDLSKADLASAVAAALHDRIHDSVDDKSTAVDGYEADIEGLASAENDGEGDTDADDESLSGEDASEIMREEAESLPSIDPEVVKDRKRRYPSERKRDSQGKVIRRGLRLNLNQPFAEKPYYLPSSYGHPDHWSPAYQAAVDAAPPQVRAILRSMALAGTTSPEEAATGGEIVARAKADGHLVSKTADRSLYAYYARVLATLGVKHSTGEE